MSCNLNNIKVIHIMARMPIYKHKVQLVWKM